MKIIKADGTLEEFKVNKLRSSLRSAGANGKEIEKIVSRIESTLTEGEHTHVIYQKAFEMLREMAEPAAAKYSLRRAVYELGPTGFPFEDFLGKLFEAEGYRVKKRLLIKGKCVTHEIDLAAYKTDDSFVVEAKFHMHPGVKSDLQVVLYSYARLLDITSHPSCKGDNCGIQALSVITNTKFTSAAIRYAECVGLRLLSWDYPRGNSLQQRIERSGLYPIPVITRLSVTQKRKLLEVGIVTCDELIRKPQILNSIGLSRQKQQDVLQEASLLCGSK